jgi:O-glycosyl hydrolase
MALRTEWWVGGVCVLLCAGLAAQTTYTVDVTKRYQRIDNFGASDAWSAQTVGRYPEATRARAADWLFSTAVETNGQPRGIGLSLWRFNIGAGSAEQGDASGIRAPMNRTECFLDAEGRYDWSKQAGQRWFLRAARARGVEQFLAFCNSAPVSLTANGRANNAGRPKDGSYNLRPGGEAVFADFLATVLSELERRDGVRFDAVSPFNEPEWAWDDAKQEGSPARVEEIARCVRVLDRTFAERRVATQIQVTESGQIDFLMKKGTAHPACENQIETLFDPASPQMIVGLPHVPNRIAGHSYWTTWPDATLRERRRLLHEALARRGLGFWQTEVCVMGNDTPLGGGNGRDLTMKTALYVARIIHYDLCVAQASAWHWWLGLSFHDYKDGLVYVQPTADGTDGALSDSRLLWTLGNYSRFVRPGAVRVDVASAQADVDDANGVLVSAFLHAQGGLVTVVLVNESASPRTVNLVVKGAVVRSSRSYVTSDAAGDTLRPRGAAEPTAACEIPARAAVTWIGRL